MKDFIIKSTEILDNTIEYEGGVVLLSDISVSVEVEIDDRIFMLEFQTTETIDSNAISSDRKSSYEASIDHSALIKHIDDYDEHEALLKAIKKESEAQVDWDMYVDEYFVRNKDYFGGFDAKSEINVATRKPTNNNI